MDVKKVPRFKCATWDIRGLGGKEEELDNFLNENNIKISVITESKKRNYKERKRLNTIRLFTVEWIDTPEANQKL
jgi:hypothetical protein